MRVEPMAREVASRCGRCGGLGERSFRMLIELLVGLRGIDPTGSEHVWRVADLASDLGRSLGAGPAALRTLWYGGLLHDVGKLRLPPETLRQDVERTARERQLPRNRPAAGAALVAELEGLEDVVPVVRHHRDRYDGRADDPSAGDPRGPAGEAIPWGARVVAVVEAFDTMVEDRPYPGRLDVPTAVAELRREARRRFDPRVVEALARLLRVP